MVRRVVSGLNKEGKSCVWSDGVPPRTHQMGGFSAVELWASRAPSPDLKHLQDITPQIPNLTINLAPGETSFRLITIPPLSGGEDSSAMHETPTIDYLVMLEGEIHLAFEDGSEAHLKAGDLIVQGGVMHSWRNRSGKPCKFAVVMVGATGGVSHS